MGPKALARDGQVYPNEVDASWDLGPSMALLNCVPGSFSCLTQTGEGSSTHSKDKLFEKVFLGKVCGGPRILQTSCLSSLWEALWQQLFLKKLIRMFSKVFSKI